MDRLPEVVERLKASGMTVEQVMEGLGTVAGRADPASVDALSKVEGVSGVERSREIRLPPPPAFLREVWAAGGIVPFYRRHGRFPGEAA